MKQRIPLSKSNSTSSTTEHVRFKVDLNEYESNPATKQSTTKDKAKSVISGETLLPRTPLVKGKAVSENVENTESHHHITTTTENKTQFNEAKRNSYYDLFNIILGLQNNVKMKLKIGIASGTPGDDTFSMFKATKKLLVRFNWNDCADPELEWGIQFFEMNPNDHDKFNKLYKSHLFADIAEDVFLEPQPANAFRLYRGKEALHLTVKEPGSAYAWADAVFAAMQLLGRNADELCHFRHLFEEEHNVQSSHIEVTRSRSLSGGSSSSRDQGDLSPRSPLSSPRGLLSDEEVSGEHKESSPRIDTTDVTSGEAQQRQDEEHDEQNEDEDREGSVVSTMSVTAAKKKKGMFKKVAKLFATRSAKDTHDHPTGGDYSPAKSPSFVSGARNAFRRMSSLGSIAEHSPRKRTTSDETEQPTSTTATSNASKAHHPPLPPAGFLSQSLMSSSPMSRRASMQTTPAAEREEKEEVATANDGVTAASNSELGSLHYKRTLEGIALGSVETEGNEVLRSFSPFQPPLPSHPQPHSQPHQPSHIPTTTSPSSSAPATKVVLRDADKQLLERHLQKRLSLRPIDSRPADPTISPVASPEGKTRPSSKSPKKSPGGKHKVAHRVVLPEGVTVLPRRTVLDRLYRESLLCDGVQQRPNHIRQQQPLYQYSAEENSPRHSSATEAAETSMLPIKSPKSAAITTNTGNELEACRLLLQRDEYYLPQCFRDAERCAVTSSVGSGFGSPAQEEFDYDSALSRYYFMSSSNNNNGSNSSGSNFNGNDGAVGKVVGLYHPIMQVLSLKKQPQKKQQQPHSSTSTTGGGATPGDDEEPVPVRHQQQHSFMQSTIDRSVPLATRLKNQISFPAQTAATAPVHTTDAPSHTKVSASHNLSLSERLAQTKSPAARKWTGGAANEHNSSVGASQSREQKLLSLLTSPKSSSQPSDEAFSIFAADRFVSNASHSTPARSQLRTGKSSLEAERRPRAVSFSSVEDHSASDSEGLAETDLSDAEQRQQKISGRSRSSEDGASSVHSHGSSNHSNHSNHSAEGSSHCATEAVSALKGVDVDLGKPFTQTLIPPLIMPGATSTHSQQQFDIHPRSAGRRNLVTALAAVSTELTPPKSAKQANGVQSMQPTTLPPDNQQTQTALSALPAAEDSGASSLDSPILVAQFSKHSVLLRVVSERDLRARGHLVHCLDLVDLRQAQRRQRLRGGEESEEALYLSVSSALHSDALHIPLSDVITADIDANGTGLFRLCVTRYFDHAYYYPQVVNGSVVDPQQKSSNSNGAAGGAAAGSIFASTLRGAESAAGEDLSSPLCLVFKAVKPATPNDWLESLFAYKEISDL